MAVGCAMAATVQTALSPRRASPIGGARVAGAAGAAIVTPGGPLRSGAAAAVVGAVGGVPRVRQAVVTAAAGRLPAAGEMGAGAGRGREPRQQRRRVAPPAVTKASAR